MKSDYQKGARELVASFVENNQHLIIETWRAEAAAEERLQSSKSLTRKDFVDHIPDALGAMCKALLDSGEHTDTQLMREQVIPHGHHRWKQGYDLEELLRDWGLLSIVLVRTLGDARQEAEENPEPGVLSAGIEIILKFMNEAMCISVREFERMKQAEARSLQADVEQARREFQSLLEARAKLLREAAHDLRGGLSTVSTASAVMQRLSAGDESRHDEMGQLMDSSIVNVQSLLDDLLDLSRLEANCQGKNLEVLDVGELIREGIQGLQASADKAGLELRVDGPASLVVSTDATALRRILQNLVLNGIKYTREGFVAVSFKCLDDHNWQLTIADTGPGLQHLEGTPIVREMDRPLEHSNRPPAEEDESREVYHGEGIGLTIVKRLCELLDASIRYKTEPDQGAVFILEFPRHYPE
jgi:signal transduction histidine kinase